MSRTEANISVEREALERIAEALAAACNVLEAFTPGKIEARHKLDGPVTDADHAVNAILRQKLLRKGEGWLSEETEDNPQRLQCPQVWVVDPIDGTKEFVAGIPEWCVSVAMVSDGEAIAGGICNPATGELVLGARTLGVTYNGTKASVSTRAELRGATILASRSEMDRGEWQRFEEEDIQIRAMGSVAYKLALVAAGRADATWTLQPKHEWDLAAGIALVQAAGGFICLPEGEALLLNREHCRVTGLVAGPTSLREQLLNVVVETRRPKLASAAE